MCFIIYQREDVSRYDLHLRNCLRTATDISGGFHVPLTYRELRQDKIMKNTKVMPWCYALAIHKGCPEGWCC
jgi:hypothetical protein